MRRIFNARRKLEENVSIINPTEDEVEEEIQQLPSFEEERICNKHKLTSDE